MSVYAIDTGVDVIDTGVDMKNADLNRPMHVNFIADHKNTDCNGHGTHVAGTMAADDNTAAVVGMAPSTPVYGVKVLDCNGSGTTTLVIKGVDWAAANAILPAVANMRLGDGASQLLDDAVRIAAARGIVLPSPQAIPRPMPAALRLPALAVWARPVCWSPLQPM